MFKNAIRGSKTGQCVCFSYLDDRCHPGDFAPYCDIYVGFFIVLHQHSAAIEPHLRIANKTRDCVCAILVSNDNMMEL